MTVEEIIQKIGELSEVDRALLRRELEETLSKTETQEASPETIKEINQERASSGDERGIPLEDVIRDPKVGT